ncbi:MAG TPA: FAD-dependent oxidoreductase [Allosphingosinicella sp.]|nr:FAD-dependent oxidoreductase [Allosphingosinicella sp.]
MAEPPNLLIAERRDQILPVLSRAEIDRIRAFGEPRRYRTGERLVAAGENLAGMFVLLEGKVLVTGTDALGRAEPIAELGPGMFLAEIGQLSGQPALFEAEARSDVEALFVPRERLREIVIVDDQLGERIMRALILRRALLIDAGAGGAVLVGRATDAGMVLLENFLLRNAFPHQLLDPDRDAEAQSLLERFHIGREDLPIVICPSGEVLRNPSEAALARCIGLLFDIDPDRLYDVAVVGAGPAGMAAAVYGASEGLAVLLLERWVFGGQAGASARIENYLGFPIGISGRALMGRAYAQAQKFGAEMVLPLIVENLEAGEDGFQLETRDGQRPRARSVVIASGAVYRRPDLPGIEDYEGSGVHYWASPIEARLCAGEEVALVGGGNSAGQAAVFLAGHVRKVHMLVRRGLAETMSRYLVDRIAALPNVELHTETEIVAVEGKDGALSAITWRDRKTGAETRAPIRHLFLFIGADPNTGWLSRCAVAVDDKGFVLTGAQAGGGRLPLETSRPGVFAIGDVRSGSTKRVAAAVGDGAQVVQALHGVLATAAG